MVELLKVIGGVSVIVTVLIAITYGLLTVASHEFVNIAKTGLAQNTMKTMSVIFLLFYSTIFFLYPVLMNEILISIIMLLYYIIYYIFHFLVKKKKKEIFTYSSKYKREEKKSNTFLGASLMFVGISGVIGYFLFKEADFFLLAAKLNNINDFSSYRTFILLVIKYLLYYISTIITGGYILSYAQFLNFPKFIIVLSRERDNLILAYLVSETDKEIIIRPEMGYPIILKKDVIDRYIPVDENCEIDEDGDIILKNGSCLEIINEIEKVVFKYKNRISK